MNYSNCLIEALKAWIKDPKNVKIVYLPRKWNHGGCHFLWIKNDKIYHYENPNENIGRLFFKGVYKEQDLETFEAFILHRLGYKPGIDKKIVAKKLHLPSLNKEGFLNWTCYYPADNILYFPEKNKICKYVFIHDQNGIRTELIENLNKDDFEFLQWKYLSPYDDMWNILNNDQRWLSGCGYEITYSRT